jgi:hypothetical protein
MQVAPDLSDNLTICSPSDTRRTLNILIPSQEYCPEINFYDKYVLKERHSDYLADKTSCSAETNMRWVQGNFNLKSNIQNSRGN